MILLCYLLLHYEDSATINLLLTSWELRAYFDKENRLFLWKLFTQVDTWAILNMYKMFTWRPGCWAVKITFILCRCCIGETSINFVYFFTYVHLLMHVPGTTLTLRLCAKLKNIKCIVVILVFMSVVCVNTN